MENLKTERKRIMDNVDKKILLVPHCFLTKGFTPKHRNQMDEVLKILQDFKTGIIQMPCPHLMLMKNRRITHANSSYQAYEQFCSSIGSEELNGLFSSFISPFIKQVEEYKQQGFKIAGLVGIKDSPSCEVRQVESGECDTQGLFMETIKRKLKERAINTSLVNVSVSPKTDFDFL
ncbi:hypothetical protein DMA11_12290 [Marinilabiliaceae bacterium JC017]|nr:hypothetical protein DMA11_12290 [Marinilabiliaceae bacterium JC017]